MALCSSEGKVFPGAPTPLPPQETSLISHWPEIDHMTPPAARKAGRISSVSGGGENDYWVSKLAWSPEFADISILIHTLRAEAGTYLPE